MKLNKIRYYETIVNVIVNCELWLFDVNWNQIKLNTIRYYETIVIVIVNCGCSIWIELKTNKIEYKTLLWDYWYWDCKL